MNAERYMQIYTALCICGLGSGYHNFEECLSGPRYFACVLLWEVEERMHILAKVEPFALPSIDLHGEESSTLSAAGHERITKESERPHKPRHSRHGGLRFPLQEPQSCFRTVVLHIYRQQIQCFLPSQCR